MKKLLRLFALACAIQLSAVAQDAPAEQEDDMPKRTFKKENLFTGGSVNASFFNGTTALGINPHFGYSVNRFIDVALSMNVSYISQRDNQYDGDKLRQNIFGPGAFVRIFPVKFLFAQAQYEHSFIRYKYIYPSGYGIPSEKMKLNANSLLVGAGYTSGRQGSNNFYYASILFDVLREPNSPYTDNNSRAIPVFKVGYNIGLFGGGR
ncbi:MAG: hypothetical protein EOO03_14270 [Chitinophagaceae bacterium]|nr:MAG: hypothetical protein EOO03_14270 [Chitinophagaceae bacterium]